MLMCDHCKKTGTLRLREDVEWHVTYECTNCTRWSSPPDVCDDGCADDCMVCCGESRNCGTCECEHHVATGLCAEHAPKANSDAAFVERYEGSDIDVETE